MSMRAPATSPPSPSEADIVEIREPINEWIVLVLLGTLVIGGVQAGAASLLQLLFPVAALAGGLLLFHRAPGAFMAYVWWIWLLTPGVRRYLDYRTGWSLVTPVALTPYLVTGVAVLGVLRWLPSLGRARFLPFAMLLAAAAYGHVVGMAKAGVMPGTYGAISWLIPIAFGVHVAMATDRYAAYQAGMRRAFCWGVMFVSVYGILQYVDPAPWDRFWMMNVPMNSIGRPLPFEVRVFSTLNSPGPFAAVLVTGMLIVFATAGKLRWPVTALAVAALSLTMVRAFWVASLIGIVVFALYLPWRQKASLIAGLVVCGMAASLLATGPVAELVRARLETLGDLSQDDSFAARMHILRVALEVIGNNPIGGGLGATGVSVALQNPVSGIRDFDNGLLETLYSLGWFAGGTFLFATGWLITRALRALESPEDRLLKAARAAAVCLVSTVILGDAFSGVAGILLWTCLGFVSAGHTVADAAWTETMS